MMKRKKAEREGRSSKLVRAIDAGIVIASLIALFASGIAYRESVFAPLAIAPAQGAETAQTSVLFEFANAERLLIDDNPEFSSPRVIELGKKAKASKSELSVSLKPGKYYWKLEGNGKSEVRELEVKSKVELVVRSVGFEGGESKFEVANAGNTLLEVEIYRGGEFLGREVVEPEDRREISVKTNAARSEKVQTSQAVKFVGKEGEG